MELMFYHSAHNQQSQWELRLLFCLAIKKSTGERRTLPSVIKPGVLKSCQTSLSTLSNTTQRYIMLLATCAVALFCFIPASSLAPPNCENLVRPLDHVDGHQLDGPWAMIAYSTVEPEGVLMINKYIDSLVMKFSNASDTSNTSNHLLESILGLVGYCDYSTSNITLEGNGFFHQDVFTAFIHTGCSDCLLMRASNVGSLHLFSKRREVEKEVMDEFKTQAECMKNQPPVMMDSSKKLCPDQKPTLSETEDLELKLKAGEKFMALENEAPDA
ncbi:hypothetical protein L3Q82_005415 [Xyrichtys novacula]|uniref:Apolipoprotein M n=1 Tax=Xyrichtys novacula TaxID=13765 RepID=A0AAV1EY22_XYRNO|nr:hypothetical protein L3Q82_005415 [Xyrichtys novacula]